MKEKELPGMPRKSKIAELNELYAEQTDDINKRRALRRGTKNEIIAEMKAMKKATINYSYGGFRYRFSIIPGDSKLAVQITPVINGELTKEE